MRPETKLRGWLRSNWEGEIAWTEAAKGGTFGLPDASVLVPYENGKSTELKIELKAWNRVRSGRGDLVKGRPRPAQVRYHFMAVKSNQPTCFLIAVRENVKVESNTIYLMPARRMPDWRSDKVNPCSWYRVGTAFGRNLETAKGYTSQLLLAFRNIVREYEQPLAVPLTEAWRQSREVLLDLHRLEN